MSRETDKVVEFPARESIELQAATWATRLGGDDFSEEDRAALDEWLGASERHRAAFQRFSSFWGDAAIL
jgi:ferric-dicitrate binding protein FerR (iron transport regulator)